MSDKMPVVVIHPPHEIFKFCRGRMPGPAMAQLAAYIEKDFNVTILDCTVLDDHWQGLEREIKRLKPKAVCISALSSSMVYDAMNTAYLIKQIDPNIVIISGGVHFTAIPEESLRECRSLDFIVLNEGDVTTPDLLSAIAAKNKDFKDIKSIAYLEGDKFIQTPDRPMIEDINTLPLPAYHLFPMDKYLMPSLGMDTHRSIILTTARGCYHKCTFCSETMQLKNTWRYKDAEHIVDEMELLYKDFGKISFMFGDNIFNGKRERIEAFADELERRSLPIHFWFQSRTDTIVRDDDILPRLKRLGLYMVSMGVETPSTTALSNYNKKQNPELAEKAMKTVKKHGLLLLTNIMFGDAEDTEETLRQTVAFAQPYSDHFAVCLATPIPGTEYHKKAILEDRVKIFDYSKYDMLCPTMTTKTLSLERIGEIHPKAIQRFYTRPRLYWNAFFARNQFLRRNDRFFAKITWEELTRKPWVQTNYMPFEKYMEQKTGKPFKKLHGPEDPFEPTQYQKMTIERIKKDAGVHSSVIPP